MNLMQTEKGIYYIHKYYPERYKHISVDDQEFREIIWAYKRMDETAIDWLTDEILEAIAVLSKKIWTKNIGLIAVPPSKVEKDSPVRESIRLIHAMYQNNEVPPLVDCKKKVYDYSILLQRSEDIPTAHISHTRLSVKQQQDSISCSVSRLWRYQTTFIVIDDITTTGASLDACKNVLIEHEANENKIYCLAIGSTI